MSDALLYESKGLGISRFHDPIRVQLPYRRASLQPIC